MIYEGLENAVPVLFQWGESVSRDWDAAVLVLFDAKVLELNFVEVNLIQLLILVLLGLNSFELIETGFVFF